MTTGTSLNTSTRTDTISAVVLTPEQNDMLRHALGLSDEWEEVPTRDYLVLPSTDEIACALVAAGFAVDCGGRSWLADDHVFRITEAGKREGLRLHAAARPRLSRSQQRYRLFLRMDMSDETFGQFLKRKGYQR